MLWFLYAIIKSYKDYLNLQIYFLIKTNIELMLEKFAYSKYNCCSYFK